MTTILAGSDVLFGQLVSRKGAVKLEALGMKHSSGRSITQVSRVAYGIKERNKVAVWRRLQTIANAMIFIRMAQTLFQDGK